MARSTMGRDCESRNPDREYCTGSAGRSKDMAVVRHFLLCLGRTWLEVPGGTRILSLQCGRVVQLLAASNGEQLSGSAILGFVPAHCIGNVPPHTSHDQHRPAILLRGTIP